MDIDKLKTDLYSVQERIARAAANGQTVTLVAATKTLSAETINAAISLGVTRIGENRAQEFVEKRAAVDPCAEWHFIGTLQRNKAKYVVGKVKLIQSVSSQSLAIEIDRLAGRLGIVQDILVEVNIGGEPSKTGAPADIAEQLVNSAQSLPNVRVRGLMAIPPRDAKDGVYASLRAMYDKYASATFDILSVGMSHDFERAIGFGSNMVRIGTAIFGNRNSTR